MDGAKMIFFKDENNKVFAFLDTDNEELFNHLTAITPTEKEVLLQPTNAQQAELDKQEINQAIDNLTVTVDTFVFKSNDKSISRMVAAILDSQTTGDTSTIWKMSDGSNQTITIDQLKTAQSLAIRAIGAMVVV